MSSKSKRSYCKNGSFLADSQQQLTCWQIHDAFAVNGYFEHDSSFAWLPEKTAWQKFTKPGMEIRQELRGDSLYPFTSEEKSSYAFISKTKTFASPTSDADHLLKMEPEVDYVKKH